MKTSILEISQSMSNINTKLISIFLVIIFKASLQTMNAEVNDDWSEEANNSQRHDSAKYYHISSLINFEKFLKPPVDERRGGAKYYRVADCSSCFSCPIGFSFSRIFRVNRSHNRTTNNEEKIEDEMCGIEIHQNNHASHESSDRNRNSIYHHNNVQKLAHLIEEDCYRQFEIETSRPLEEKRQAKKNQIMFWFWEELCKLEIPIINDSDYDNSLAVFISLKILASQIFPLIMSKLQLNLGDEKLADHEQKIDIEAWLAQVEKGQKIQQLWEELCDPDKAPFQDDPDRDNNLAVFIALKILTSRICPLIVEELQFKKLIDNAQQTNIEAWKNKKSQVTLQLWEELYGLKKTPLIVYWKNFSAQTTFLKLSYQA